MVISIFGKTKFILFGLACVVGLYVFVTLRLSAVATKDELVIYSYSSFTAKWGPGPLLKQRFEELCHCKIEIRDADDSRLLLQRLQMEGKRVRADVVIGLNQWDVDEAVDKLGFQEIPWEKPQNSATDLLKANLDSGLIPFDWGILTLNTKRNSDFADVKSLKEFLEKLPEKGLALQDPRTSAPGLSFLFWLVDIFGEDGAFDFLNKLEPKIFTIAPGWSASYGLFQKGQVQAVFSYITSPLYHQIEEKDFNYKALALEEGLPIHIEFAGVLSSCRQCERAAQFIGFLVSKEAQDILMKKNYMLPVDLSIVEQTPWDVYSKYKTLPLKSIDQSEQKRILERWTQWVRSR